MARGMLLEMLGAREPTRLRLVGKAEAAYRQGSNEGVKKPRLRPLERRKIVASF